jgi:hypothetical protein
MTTNATATDLGPSMLDMTDDDFEAFAAWAADSAAAFEKHLATKTMVGRLKPARGVRHTARDRLGRFVRVVRVDALEAEGVFVNASDGTTHAHVNCGNLKGTTWTLDTVSTGWLCTACVEVPVSAFAASHNVATVHGTQVCDTCNTDKGVRSFPTVVEADVWRLRGTTCRKCEKATRSANKAAEAVALVNDLALAFAA